VADTNAQVQPQPPYSAPLHCLVTRAPLKCHRALMCSTNKTGAPAKGYDERSPLRGYPMAAGLNEMAMAPTFAGKVRPHDFGAV
jgi:hypothetical protein